MLSQFVFVLKIKIKCRVYNQEAKALPWIAPESTILASVGSPGR
jgi:hypothetical protein